MTDGEKLAKAIALIEDADALIQEVFSGSPELYAIYQTLGRAVDDVNDLAGAKGIVIPEA